jgi:hypothetical protein
MAAGPAPARPPEGAGRVPAGLIAWSRDHDAIVGGRYRIRNLAPLRWELTFRDRTLSEHRRLSMAKVSAELHHRGALRRAGLVRWGTVAAGGVAVALVFAGFGGASGILGTIGGLSLFLIAAPRFVAALTGSLLDPYRRRDPWEPDDWWNRNP